MALTADVTRTADVEGAVRAVVERWGRLDILVNNLLAQPTEIELYRSLTD